MQYFLRLSGHNFPVETQRHHGNRCPYELRIYNKCDWYTVQDEEHVILHRPSQDLTEVCTHFQHLPVFSSVPPSSASRLRGFMNQADVLGLAKHIWLQLSCPRRQAITTGGATFSYGDGVVPYYMRPVDFWLHKDEADRLRRIEREQRLWD
eukprot:1158722-Pelagomonas_calceolata.AAC.5